MAIDWKSIRPLNGAQDRGFEELCAQLARAEAPRSSTFVRKGTPDAGVECYCVLQDDSEWGWQAKYIDSLDDSQWSQIDDSIKTALDKHPKLARYFVCAPLDRPDARIRGRKSAKERWDEHVTKWQGWASKRGMVVAFDYWGSAELLERLARPENVGRVKFWFDIPGFDGAWFAARLDEMLRTAGPRYTPQVHIELPIAQQFEDFGRTEQFFNRQRSLARNIRDALKRLNPLKSPEDIKIDEGMDLVIERVKNVLSALGAIQTQPTGVLPLGGIARSMDAVLDTCTELSRLIEKHAKEAESNSQQEPSPSSHSALHQSPYRERQSFVASLALELRSAREQLLHADEVAGKQLLLLNGSAGTGKTHLLCDIAKHRIEKGHPTIILMGQRFASHDAPWTQALQQLDLSNLSAGEFVGALEAAAQAAGSRALIIVDALNEGTGRFVWPHHLEAFLAHAERSPWIGVVLSVRSSYEELILPQSVRERAAHVTHYGFADAEYDAVKSFFLHYGLELPTTPFLIPEFQNPLFLKTLCQGLNGIGERRLPRGFQGVTRIFDLFLTAINKRLARTLDYDPKEPLVRRALEAVALAIHSSENQLLSRRSAIDIVNKILPGRDFERSLFRGMVLDGILIEEVSPQSADPNSEDIVFVAYERFCDHLVVKALLDKHLGTSPELAFRPGEALGFICDENAFISPGLLEAFCTQIPERLGQELVSIAPDSASRWDMGRAFRQSLIWRDLSAFTEETRTHLNAFNRSGRDGYETLDTLLTLAILPEHPFNAHLLDNRLRKDTMAERDAWWSIYLHRVWGSRGPVDRLVDWASLLDSANNLEEESIDLCAISLAWMLTTSNRFLRDRATQALVNLLTNRFAAMGRLVNWLTDIDDLYVSERVYAVAYGVAMRSQDPVAVAELARIVFEQVFALRKPTPHILLRDYARGVIERALHLGVSLDIDTRLIRPPYQSQWPAIPTEDEIRPLLPDWSQGAHDSGELEWSRNRIGSSIMSDDFGRYVIGTNSSLTSRSWLSVKLSETPWEPPLSPQESLQELVDAFSVTERESWERYATADKALELAMQTFVVELSSEQLEAFLAESPNESERETGDDELTPPIPADVAALLEKQIQAKSRLESILTEAHLKSFREIEAVASEPRGHHIPPRLDLKLIQRFVLSRVFDLGWTIERFGEFDRVDIGYSGREAAKAERMGKKYQWIAYHEILAHISDRYQHYESLGNDEFSTAYEGPWQDYLRNIDPSCTLRALPGDTLFEGHAPAWWCAVDFDSWGLPDHTHEWATNTNDIPDVAELLYAKDIPARTQWLVGQGYYIWRQAPPADRDTFEVERRELWCLCNGYLIHERDTQSFLDWAEGVNFMGRWMPEAPQVYGMFLGEHGWSPASSHFSHTYFGEDGWTQPGRNCPVEVRTLSFEYLREARGFDCSIDESYSLHLPNSDLINGLDLKWSGRGADFINQSREVIAQDPAAHFAGPSSFLLRSDVFQGFLKRQQLALCWAILGEKGVISPGFGTAARLPAIQITGAYVLANGQLQGFTKHLLDDPSQQTSGYDPDRLKLIGIIRTPER